MFENQKPHCEGPPDRDPLMDRMIKEARTDMAWEKAEGARLDPEAYYLVKTNGGEWLDHDLAIMRAKMIEFRLQPHYVRGRPEWVAKITNPKL